MDNENMRENEELYEKNDEENFEAETETVDDTVEEPEVTEYAEETEELEEYELSYKPDNGEIITDNPKPKKGIKEYLIIGISIVVAIIVAITIYCICVINGVGKKSIVNTPEYFDGRTGLDVKYENPMMTLMDKIVLGKNDTAVLKVNGKAVSEKIFDFYLSYTVNDYINSRIRTDIPKYIQEQDLSDQAKIMDGVKRLVDDIDWKEKDEKTGLALKEQMRARTVDTLIVPMYAFINEGEKRGVALTESDIKEIDANLVQMKASYGAEFNTFLSQNGFADEETYIEMLKLMVLMEKVVEDFNKDMTKYISEEELKEYIENDEYISAKHILIMPEENAEDPVAAMAEAKALAEDVLARAKAGEDFDKLIELYDQDPGQTAEGYTFANDGTMAQEFADAAFALKANEISDIVETQYGYHIIKRFDKAPNSDDYMAYLNTKAKVVLKPKYDSKEMTKEEIYNVMGIQ